MKTISRILAGATCVLALLTACGGGTSQVTAYRPGKLLAFGDEFSTLTTNGRKYAVNGINASGNIDCDLNPLWIQAVASSFGFRFSQCLGTATEARAITYAAPGATVAAVTRQIDSAASTIVSEDLVLIMAGLNDIIEIYQTRAAGETDEQLLARARARGVALADQVNRLVGLGARVIVATMPDAGVSPWALSRGAADARLLSQLSLAFNGRLRVGILNDGRFIGLVLADELTQSAVAVPQAYGFSNWTAPVCLVTAALPNCTNAASSLVAGANEATYMWADSRFFGTVMHRQIGLAAADRAARNPF